ncbi:FAD-dependent oxidoreductase [Desulforhopalus sp. IMCC35007]|uniref:FAD-dependent oxidoreductase n=1 Tax=Desulforhopalus sp. IMCC35007 TaxID=2569543 RepID=UPI0010AE4850|nr:FAD-dependent oxidoreductase [Desulforhopalus sp. IMCC35007]
MTGNLKSLPQPGPSLTGAVMVIGGGISGMQSALDLANSGIKVYLVERSSSIGGKMAQLDKTFPTNDCSMCIVSPKLVEVGRHRDIELLTHSEVKGLSGEPGNFTAKVVRHARYVDVGTCTGCGLCELVCPVTHISTFPPQPEEGEKKKKLRAKVKETITGGGSPQPTSLYKWTFTVDESACSMCGGCFNACLQGAVKWEKKSVATIDQDKCTGCGACYVACPEKFKAITVSYAADLDKSIGAALYARSELLKKGFASKGQSDCLRCGLCVITCDKVMNIGALKMVETGIEAGVDICQVCGACVSMCPVGFLAIDKLTNKSVHLLENDFNEGLNGRKPINILYPQAVPRVPVIDEKSCVHLNTGACGTCATICGVGAIHYESREEEIEIEVGSVIFSPGIEVFDARIRGEFGYGYYKNVVTSIEFERLLSASGPTSGTVARPGDNKHPKKIAWIQCVGSRDHSCDRDYCSSVCCMYATKEAFIAREHDSSIEPTIFYIDMRSFGKNFDDYVERAKEHKVRFVRAMVSRIFEDPVTGDLELRYVDAAGLKRIEQFDMVVLSVGVQVPQAVKDLAGTLDIELDKYGFAVTDGYTPLATSRPGVFVSGAVNGPKDIPETVCEASGAAEAASAALAGARGNLIRVEELPQEQVFSDDDELRIGVFICHCGTNIASVVDVEAVMEYAKTLPGVVYAEHPLYTCSQDSQERMRSIIKEHRLNRVVTSACSPTTHEPLFQSTLRQAGLNKYYFDMANIRDQCSWVHPDDPVAATEKSKRLTRMAVANATAGKPLEELEFSVDSRLLIVGGGVAGMTAALEAAKQGFGVYLVEREPILGGHLRNLQRGPDGRKFTTFIDELVEEVLVDERIRIFTSSEVVEQAGFVGAFETDIVMPSGATRTLKHGAILIATGAEENRPEIYGLGSLETVITQTDFEQALEGGGGAGWENLQVTMLQCAGSRDKEYLPYCSRVCCNHAVKNSLHLKEMFPHARVDVLYRDMRCYGLGEIDYRLARQAGVNFIRFDPGENPPKIRATEEGIEITITDPSVGFPVELQPDLLVLSTGMRPRDTEDLASMLRVPRNDAGFFIEAHAKLRPVDLPSEGLFMAGTAHGPKSSSEAIVQAQAAVARAVTLLSQEKLQMSGVVSTVDPTHCAVCLTCVRACPYGVPFINDQHSAEINPALCQGCGICVAECPAKAIHLGRFGDRNIRAKIEAYSVMQS